MHGLVRWFLNNPVAANLLMFLVVIAGLLSLTSIRIEGFPKIPANTVNIAIESEGFSPSEIDENVTLKVNKALADVPGIKKITSHSIEGLSNVSVQKSFNYDIQKLLIDVKTKVEGIYNLPKKARKPVITIDEYKDFGLVVQVYGKTSDDALQKAAKLVKKKLQASSYISKIESFGRKNNEVLIQPNIQKLKSYDLTNIDLQNAVNAYSQNYKSGALRSNNGIIYLRSGKKAKGLKYYANIPVKTTKNGNTILIKDVADVYDGIDKDSESITRFQGMPSVGYIIFTSPKGDLIKVSKETADIIKVLEKQLPPNIKVDQWADMSNYMQSRLSLLKTNAWQGLLIVWVILALFLNFRLAFWVAMGIPFSIAGVLFFMKDSILAYTLNDVTTFGFIIALGILVDDAVVVGESVYEERKKTNDAIQGTYIGVVKVSTATVFGMLTSVAAFSSLMLIKSELGQAIAGFAVVIIVALGFSMLESKLVLPAHLASINIGSRNGSFMNKAWKSVQKYASNALSLLRDKIYSPVLNTAVRYKYSSLVIFITIFAIAIWSVNSGRLRTVFFPNIPGDMIFVNLEMKSESSLKKAKENILIIEEKIQKINSKFEKQGMNPPIKKMMTYYDGEHKAEIYAELRPQKERKVNTLSLTEEIRTAVGTLEGVKKLAFNASEDTGGGFSLRIISENSFELKQASKMIIKLLSKIEGVSDINTSSNATNNELKIRLKDSAKYLNIDPISISEQLGNNFGGLEVERFFREREEVITSIKIRKNSRKYISDLKNFEILSKDNIRFFLGDIAHISMDKEESFIERTNGEKTVTIVAKIDKQKISDSDIFKYLDKDLKDMKQMFSGLKITQAGEAEEAGKMKKDLISAFIIVCILIYTLLAVPLKSYFQPIVIMSVIPFGIIGAIAGHLIIGIPMSFLSFFGIMALTGIIVNDSLVMMTRHNDLIKEGANEHEALTLAGISRFRAIILTTLTTVCGLLPLIMETSEQAQYLIPAAVSLAFGELFGTAITLLLIPIFLSIGNDIKKNHKVSIKTLLLIKKGDSQRESP